MKVKIDPNDFAFNGKDAIDKIINKKCLSCLKGYKLVFMDLNMPIMDGYETSKVLSKLILE